MRQMGKEDRKIKKDIAVAQFGEGNFLRGFADHMIDVANEKGVLDYGIAIIKPIEQGSLDAFVRQDSVFSVILRGIQNGKKVVDHRIIGAVSQVVDPFADYESYIELACGEALKFVISNTTEAGIVYDEGDKFDRHPASTFPGKLVQFLYARYGHFDGNAKRGLIILPAELIEQNGTKLQECVQKLIKLWNLPEAFAKWVNDSCIFCNCLVDRIVSGYPDGEAEALERDLLGCRDELMTIGEPFGLWVIASPRWKEVQAAFPLDRAGLPVVFTDDEQPYRERKVRLLNGAHTSMVLAAHLMGHTTVKEAMDSPDVRAFIEKALYAEISPTVKLPPDEVRAFADSVIERFENPFLAHKLLSIALNSVSKWKARILPSLKDSLAATGKLPDCLTFSLAALAEFYRKSGKSQDESYVMEFFAKNSGLPTGEFVVKLLGNTDFWGEDLNSLPELGEKVTAYVEDIEVRGIVEVVKYINNSPR